MDELRNKIQLSIIGIGMYGGTSVDLQLTEDELLTILDLIDNA